MKYDSARSNGTGSERAKGSTASEVSYPQQPAPSPGQCWTWYSNFIMMGCGGLLNSACDHINKALITPTSCIN